MRTKAFFFDLDGTLVDSLPDIHAGIRELARRQSLPVPPEEVVASMIGKGIRVLVERLASWWRERGVDLDESAQENLLPELISVWSAMPDLVRPIPGALECVASLRSEGFKVALVTNKIRERTVEFLDRRGLSEAFDAVVTASDCERVKPWPDMLQLAASIVGVQTCECVMVGDSQNDALAAKAAGMQVLLVRTGYNEGVDIDLWSSQHGFTMVGKDVPTVVRDYLKGALC